eukprot:COSAG01_NODE_814_length_13398_cov_4.254230_2_plen_404_part_00
MADSKRILICSQVYWPDSSSVSQHLTDLAEALVKVGHQVSVLSSRMPYEDSQQRYIVNETHRGVQIQRLSQLKFKKQWLLGRVLSFFTFKVQIFWQLLFKPSKDFDVLFVVSVPPILPALVCFLAKLKRKACIYWTMDIQPELSIASRLIKKNTVTAKLLSWSSSFTARSAQQLLCLDEDMKRYLITKGANASRISCVPVWPVNTLVCPYSRSQNPFRLAQNWGEKQVIMYSGNLAFCHPLDSILELAVELATNPDFLFVFIGGGVQLPKVKAVAAKYQNIQCLPFQDRDQIHISLGASDYQVVVMGNETQGYTHPNKIYGAMLAAKPIIYVGPGDSFIAKHLNNCPGNISAEHGHVSQLKNKVLALADNTTAYQKLCEQNYRYAKETFNTEKLIKDACRVFN